MAMAMAMTITCYNGNDNGNDNGINRMMGFVFTGAIRKSSPLMVSSLLLLIIALGLSTVGNTKRDGKTLIGAVVYIMSG